MRFFKIKLDSEQPYIKLKMDAVHPELGQPKPAQRGEVLLAVLDIYGNRNPLPFYNHEIEEVK
jgi:hypothetical protein